MPLFYRQILRTIQGLDVMNSQILDIRVDDNPDNHSRSSNRSSNRMLCYHSIYLSAALLLIGLILTNDDAREVTSESFN